MSKRILVIDDEIDICDVVCLALEEFGGWVTDSSDSGQAGLNKACEQPWDAILLDVSMPDMDGYAVIQQLQDNAQTCDIPVILLTAKSFLEVNRQAPQGAAGIISKPFDPLAIWRQVAAILGWSI
jgi:CheY-like chemotaxis protein